MPASQQRPHATVNPGPDWPPGPALHHIRQLARIFLASLFDLKFKQVLTTRMVPAIYSLGIVLFAVLAASVSALGFSVSFLVGVFYLLVVAPALFFALVIAMRVALEFVLAVFRLLEVTEKMYGKTAEMDENLERLTNRVEEVSSVIPRIPWPFGK